ncbi:hypothetical protein [Actinoplanes sp. URMC 104]|uniref:hypothetical protein n=1 Tax=Actinoplanes sp. URMC 104 TaxID=3423409 RepID=UPI003F1E35D4
MPGQRFTVALPDESTTFTPPAADDAKAARKGRGDAEHHGARDGRQAARERSERARSGRAASAGTGRSYAFRRS